eukprot:CAMPEP_0116040308 /NCGR_PEP_ID=MMETSP0321-20121206/24277_1 /TAXON_ID=163516 /ORGANISM="Leptocylindrus danicus var. danicus, Strain B650" /LENGTH=515 /DNA_ID=CAMNT_0003520089 /DNA_START=184 /DNA_END=1731 /DNA_ORIENTATION=+
MSNSTCSVRQASKATEESGATATPIKSCAATNEPKAKKQVWKSLDPLVTAMIKGASDEEILNNYRLLTDENVVVRDNALALHLAIERDYSLEIIQKLATPEAMLQPNAYGYPPLHNAIMNEREYYVVLSLLGLNPDAAAMQLYDCGSLPLHAAVRNQYSLEVIRALVSAFPDGVVVTDHFGCTPLHAAIMHMYSNVEMLAVIQLFLAQSANTVAAIPNVDGDLPLHAVLRSKQLQLQLQLIEGEYLGMVCVQILVDAFPMALEIPDANGCIPLHIALLDKKMDVIECLLEKNEATASIAGFDDGELPLHFALANHYPLGIIQPLVDAFPEGLLVSNSSDDFPIFAALRRKDDCIVMVKYFLSKLPKSSALKSMNRLPIHLAIELCLSTEVICALLVAYPNSLSVGCNGNLPKDLTSVATEPLIVVALEKSIGFWAFYAHRFRVKGESLDVVINDAMADLEGTHGLYHEVGKKRVDDRMEKDINGKNRSSDSLEGFSDSMKRVEKAVKELESERNL